MTVLLDTDVLIDCLRGLPVALAWIHGHSGDTFQVPGVAAMELLVGCRNQAEVTGVRRFLSSFEVVWPDPEESSSAFELLAAYRTSSGIGIPDCIVAAMAMSRSARVYTFNAKHFRAIPDLDIAQPYVR